jgi:protein-S-isoprenylcysteine O-methyltransferase Ste14
MSPPDPVSPCNPPWLSLKVPPLALFILLAAAMWQLPAVAPARLPGAMLLSAVLATMGAAISIAGILAFRRARTTVSPIDPSTSTALVVRGVYRITRNPMYLGFALLLLAFAAWLGSLSALLLVPLFMAYLQRFQIRPEEDALRARFGTSFETYRQQIRRWL